MSLLRIEGLQRPGLAPVDLLVEAGQCLCLSGPSGAGKSLLLRSIADMDPHEGQMWVGDTACQSLTGPQWRQRVGLLPAESRWWLPTVGEHFKRIDTEAFEALGFAPEVAGWEVNRLSTGERQRLALLRLLAISPEVLLLDEPTAALDAASVARVEQLIARVRERDRLAVVWVSHDAGQIQRVCGKHLVMTAGQLEAA